MEIRLTAEILITPRSAKVFVPGYEYPIVEIGYDGSSDVREGAAEWLERKAQEAMKIQRLAARIIEMSDNWTAGEIARFLGAREVICRLHRIDNEAPIYEHQWEVGDAKLWVLISHGQVVGVRAR